MTEEPPLTITEARRRFPEIAGRARMGEHVYVGRLGGPEVVVGPVPVGGGFVVPKRLMRHLVAYEAVEQADSFERQHRHGRPLSFSAVYQEIVVWSARADHTALAAALSALRQHLTWRRDAEYARAALEALPELVRSTIAESQALDVRFYERSILDVDAIMAKLADYGVFEEGPDQ